MIRPGMRWYYRRLELYWYTGAELRDAWGLVWSMDPRYCIVSVLVSGGEYSLGFSRKHKLDDDEAHALQVYLHSHGLTEKPEELPKKRAT